MAYYKDLTGQVFGNLTAMKYMGTHEQRGASWLCKCICGNEVIKKAGALKGGTKSCSTACGVSKSNQQRATHGQARGARNTPQRNKNTKPYNAWKSMNQRCYNLNSEHYDRYGGRGITVCAEWRDSFETFYKDVGEPPTTKHTLDRIDNNGNYEPSNVRWATRKEQANNRETNMYLEMQGKQMTYAEWAEYLGVPYHVVQKALKKKFNSSNRKGKQNETSNT
jgi:hypothetical protein